MQTSNHNFTFLFLTFLFLSSIFNICRSQGSGGEPEDESEFSYIKGSETGPEKWGKIKPEWEACGKGDMQSPIDLLDGRVYIVPNFGQMRRHYKPAHAVLRNRGHDVAVEWKEQAGKIKLRGVDYKLQQCHWHSPSEHSFNGSKFELELHMVHESAGGKIAVVGVIYKIGPPDPFLEMLLEHVTSVPAGEEKELGIVDPNQINIWPRQYFRYLGSLTVPPCTEGVIWTISKKVRTVSEEQVKALREAVHDGYEANARPTQKLKGRPVLYYTEFFRGRPWF